MTRDNVLFQNWYFFGVKNISSHTHKTGSWYLLGVKNISSHANKTASWYLLGVKNISSHANKTGSWYLFGLSSKFQRAPRAFHMEVPPPPPDRNTPNRHILQKLELPAYLIRYLPMQTTEMFRVNILTVIIFFGSLSGIG